MRTWKPDTCGCVVEEIYNGTEIVGGGVVIEKCPAHTTVPDVDLYGVLYANPDGENKMKNMVHRVLLGYESVQGLNVAEEKFNERGDSAGLGLKKGIEYEWSFSGEGASRQLNVSLRGHALTSQQKGAIANFCETRFGSSRVRVI